MTLRDRILAYLADTPATPGDILRACGIDERASGPRRGAVVRTLRELTTERRVWPPCKENPTYRLNLHKRVDRT